VSTGEDSNHLTAPPHSAPGLSVAALEAENERLRQRVRQLEEERGRDRQALTTLQIERDACLRSLHASAWERVTEDELRRWAEDEEEDGATLAQVFEKLGSHQEP
jgi:hypothetical protein